MPYKAQTPFLSSSISFFPIETYEQETDKWINPYQDGYEKPILDKKVQESYLKNLHQRLFGTASPWDQTYVKQILQTDIWASEKNQLTIFSNQDELSKDKWYGINFRLYPKKKIENIADAIPLDELKRLSFHKENRAITTKNLLGRSLPTTDIYVRSIMPGYGYPLDKIQASSLFIGTPIYVINQTKDKRWSLVITPDFIVWVESDGIAYTDDGFIEKWKSVAQENIAAIIQTDTPLVNQQGNFLTIAYIGTLFPARSGIMDKLILSVPITDKEGKAFLSDVVVNPTHAA
ncbi:SH3 domain-containing protein, partial [Candidatus Cardinium hertigii]|uniref:SH3 domain-containing protein n=1 Tax=Candidatus Cardinium hertigii TaxID=247481 RepID=UPI003D7C63CC